MSKQLRVADVLSDTTIVINAGTDQQISDGDQFVVIEDGPIISDPETGERLGRLEIKKGQFVAVDVQPRVTIARMKKKTITKKRRVPSQFDFFRGAAYEEYEVEVADSVKLEISSKSYPESLVIRKNDLVRKL